VGVDVGTKRVGLATSDPLRLFAQVEGTYPPEEALDTLDRENLPDWDDVDRRTLSDTDLITRDGRIHIVSRDITNAIETAAISE